MRGREGTCRPEAVPLWRDNDAALGFWGFILNPPTYNIRAGIRVWEGKSMVTQAAGFLTQGFLKRRPSQLGAAWVLIHFS